MCNEIDKLRSKLSRMTKVRDLMLEVTRFALKTEDINRLLQLILENALESIENGTVGSILMKENEELIIASHVGFCEDIKYFRLPVEKAFIYTATEGKMDRIVNIPDLRIYANYFYIKTNYGEEKYIKSTLSAPIYIHGCLFGVINIDSVETNSFDEDDVKTMEFIRNYIEIIITNYLLYEEKSYLARYDQLTNFYNRAYFEKKAGNFIKNARLYKGSFCLVVYDINDLKIANDTYGHLAGDRILREFSHRLKSNIRGTDFVGRLGGDEFIAIFPNAKKENIDEKFSNLLKQMEKEPLCINGHQVKCTFSYGIASFPKDGTTLKDLITIADDKMYDFKREYKKHNKQS